MKWVNEMRDAEVIESKRAEGSNNPSESAKGISHSSIEDDDFLLNLNEIKTWKQQPSSEEG